MPPRRLIKLMLAPEAVEGLSDDVLGFLVNRSLYSGFGDALGEAGLFALSSALYDMFESQGGQDAPEKDAIGRTLYERFAAGRSAVPVDFGDFDRRFGQFTVALGEALGRAREPRLTDPPGREFGELSIGELARMQVPEALSSYMNRLARSFGDRGVLEPADAEHVIELVEKMAGAPGYLRFLGEEKRREETARLSGMAMAVLSAGPPSGSAVMDMMTSLGLLLFNISPSERTATYLEKVPPSTWSQVLKYHYNAVLALNHLLAGRLDLASSHAAIAMRNATEPGALAYIYILQGCVAIRMRDYDQGIALLNRAGDKAPDGRIKALASFYQGIVYSEKKEYVRAIVCFEEAGAGIADPADAITIYGNIGSCAICLGDEPRAEQALSKIRALSVCLEGDRAQQCQLMVNSYGGAICHARGEYAKATGRYQQALKLAIASSDINAIANQLGNLGLTYARSGDGDQALQFLNACMAYSERAGYWPGIRFAYWHICRQLKESGSEPDAKEFSEIYLTRYPELRNLRSF